MTPPNEQQLPEDHGDLHDRLMDSVLQESLGGDAPPDLTQRILAAAQHSADAPAETASHAEKSHAASSASHARRWGLLAAIAASLLVAVTLRRMTTVVQMDATNSLPIVAQGPADESKSLRFDDALPANALPANGPPAYDLSAYALPTDASSDFVELLDLSTEAKGESREYFAGQELSRGGANVPASGAVDQLAAVAPTPSRFRIQSQEQTRNPSLSLFEQPPAAHTVDGQGPGQGGDQYDLIVENAFRRTLEENLSTFSIDVDTASYANVRQFLLDMHRLPPADAVRIEELVNYFDYLYAPPSDEEPFAVHVETASCPWEPAHRLVRIGVKGREIDTRARPLSNLVFLIDVSGSMNQPNKLPLLVEGMKMMTRELSENDRVAVVVYASSEGLALPSTPGTEQETILAALDRLSAGGSTAGGAGIKLAYETARQNFIEGGVNRVILCTDGDFNVGVTSPGELERMAEDYAKESDVFLTVLGFGRGNLNDAMLERISGKGNGNYHYIDRLSEAQKVLVEEMSGTLVTIAKDVKLQVDFNPKRVAGYRLIGYENRVLAKEDFNDDRKDAGEIGAGHTVTALYEIVPVGTDVPATDVEPSEYVEQKSPNAEALESEQLLTVRVRYKQPDGDESVLRKFPAIDSGQRFGQASPDFQFAAAVAGWGMLLRGSQHSGDATLAGMREIAASTASAHDPHGRRAELLQLIDASIQLQQQQ